MTGITSVLVLTCMNHSVSMCNATQSQDYSFVLRLPLGQWEDAVTSQNVDTGVHV